MICRIRYVKIRQGSVEEYRKLASDWQALIQKYGGKVLGFYYDRKQEQVTGIAEYRNMETLNELQKRCEADASYPEIRDRIKKLVISVEEQVLEKLDTQTETETSNNSRVKEQN